MTFQDAIQNKIKKIRLPVWEPSAYLELPLLADGIGPLAKIHDQTGDVMVGMWNFDDDTTDSWQEFREPTER